MASTAAGAVLGLDCRHEGTVGIVTGPWSSPRYAAPHLPGTTEDDVTVLRLSVSGHNWSALLAGQSSKGTSSRAVTLFAASSSDSGASWQLSAPLVLARLSGPLVADPFGMAGWAVWQGGQSTVQLFGGRGTWLSLPAPPNHTVALAASANGQLTAFATLKESLRVTVYGLAPGSTVTSGRWTRLQSIFVPIEFGSSS